MPFPYTVDLGDNGGLLRFRKSDEISAFVQEQWDAWSWLPEAVNSIPNANSSMQSLSQKWPGHAGIINSIRDSLNDGNSDAAINTLTGYFGSAASLPLPSSFRGAIVLESKTTIGPWAGIGALATILDLACNPYQPVVVRGIVAAHEALRGTGKAARQSVQTGLAALLKRFSDQQQRVEDKADALDREVERIEQRRRKQFNGLLAHGAKARKDYSTFIQDQIHQFKSAGQGAIEEINKTKTTFEEYMRLAAPVQYWRLKAKEHRIKAWISGAIGLAFAFLLIWYSYNRAIGQILTLVENAIAATHQWQVGYVVLTVVVFILTVIFWIGRLVSRTYVSQSHLAIDAEERATMVETYLALTAENKISDAERILVLGSLFRASSDGLVKDDGAPDVGIPGWVSKAVSGEGGPK